MFQIFITNRGILTKIKSGLIIFLVLVTGWLALAALVADAHANLVRSDPPADAVLPSGRVPNQIQLWFSEQPDPAYSSIRVVDARSQVVSTGGLQVVRGNPQSLLVSLKPDLADGTYTVIWKTASAVDGHLVKSAFSFVVGNAATLNAASSNLALIGVGPKVATGNDATNLSPIAVWLRWLNYVAGALLLGCAGFGLLVWQPALKIAVQKYGLSDLDLKRQAQLGWSRLNWLAGGALLGLVLGWVAAFVYQLTIVTGRDWLDAGLYGVPLTDFALNSRFGQIWLIRLGLLVLAMLALNFAISSKTNQNGLHRRSWWALVSVGAAILLTTSLNSHAAAQIEYTWFTVSLDWLHLLSTAFWIGGVLSLVLLLPPTLKSLTPGTGERTRVLAALIPLFSRLALLSVVVLVFSGFYSSLIEVGSVEALFSTLYGQVLVAKLVLFGFTLALAAGNLLRISPQMTTLATNQQGKAGSTGAGRLQLQFKQAIALEAVLLIAVLLSVGVLTSLEPARQPGGNTGPQNMVQTAAGLHFDLTISPGQAGINNFTLNLTDRAGRPVSNPTLVQLRLQMLEMDMGEPILTLKPGQPGFYTGTGAILSMVGTWRIAVFVQRPGQDDISVPFQLNVNH